MPFIKHSNVAMYGEADWRGFVQTVPNCSPENAQRIARQNPLITFFFFCRGSIILNNPEGPDRIFQPGDAVFFSGTLWPGSADQCDTYVQSGLAVAYLGNLGTAGNLQLPTQFTTADGLNAIDIVCLAAANLRITPADKQVRLAPNVDVPQNGTLAVASSYYPNMLNQVVPSLHAAGISVVLSFQNYWDAAGWSEFSSWSDAQTFAEQLNYIIATYDLDGIDIDDEYSNGTPNSTSLAMVTCAIRAIMPNIILSKALFADNQYLSPKYDGKTFWQNLTYGWEMSYGIPVSQILPTYIKAGLSPSMLLGGFSGGQGSTDPQTDVTWLMDNGCRGFMVWNFQDKATQQKMGRLVDDWCGEGNWNQASSSD